MALFSGSENADHRICDSTASESFNGPNLHLQRVEPVEEMIVDNAYLYDYLNFV